MVFCSKYNKWLDKNLMTVYRVLLQTKIYSYNLISRWYHFLSIFVHFLIYYNRSRSNSLYRNDLKIHLQCNFFYYTITISRKFDKTTNLDLYFITIIKAKEKLPFSITSKVRWASWMSLYVLMYHTVIFCMIYVKIDEIYIRVSFRVSLKKFKNKRIIIFIQEIICQFM